jgi:hypothetical protein
MSETAVAELDLPRGTLVRSRVGVTGGLDAALSRDLTGYARIEPDSLLADGEPGVLTFEDGIPVAAYCERGENGSQRGDSRGVDALAALAVPGPCAVELFELPDGSLDRVHDQPSFTVPPGAPAEELADDAALAERARERAPAAAADRGGTSALESFLEDEERIAAIQEEAREESEKRAAEWGLAGELEQ